MKIIELYSDDILDVISLGQSFSIFDEKNGDYIKIELRDAEIDTILHTFYSNRLLLEHEVGGYYFEDYHYNSETGHFMEGTKHTDKLHGNLLPTQYYHEGGTAVHYTNKKQFNIYRDASNRIYIKPNEILEKVNLEENKYKLVLYFLQDIKSTITAYLNATMNNLIPNGNFFMERWAMKYPLRSLLEGPTIGFEMRGSYYDGDEGDWPHYTIKINNVEISDGYIDHDDDRWYDFELPSQVSDYEPNPPQTNDTFKLEITFDNDGAGGGADRNLYVRKIRNSDHEVIWLMNFNDPTYYKDYTLEFTYLQLGGETFPGTYSEQYLQAFLNNGGMNWNGIIRLVADPLKASNPPNKIIQLPNPGRSAYVLEQTGHVNNEYEIKIAGITPNTDYVVSCWSMYNQDFNGWKGMFNIRFNSTGGQWGAGDSNSSDVPGWVFETQVVDGQLWEHRYLVLHANDNADLGTTHWYLGYQNNQTGMDAVVYDQRPTNPNARRYFTDLRFEKLSESGIKGHATRTDGRIWEHYPPEDFRDANWMTADGVPIEFPEISNGSFGGGNWAGGGNVGSNPPNTIISMTELADQMSLTTIPLNPGGSEYVLEQTGHEDNEYEIVVGGITPGEKYVVSCWSMYNQTFDGLKGMFVVRFNSTKGHWGAEGSNSNDVPGWVFETYTAGSAVDEMMWEHRYLVLHANENADLGTAHWRLGYQNESGRSSHTDARRYFTDLKFEKLEGSSIEGFVTRTDGQQWSDYPAEDSQTDGQTRWPIILDGNSSSEDSYWNDVIWPGPDNFNIKAWEPGSGGRSYKHTQLPSRGGATAHIDKIQWKTDYGQGPTFETSYEHPGDGWQWVGSFDRLFIGEKYSFHMRVFEGWNQLQWEDILPMKWTNPYIKYSCNVSATATGGPQVLNPTGNYQTSNTMTPEGGGNYDAYMDQIQKPNPTDEFHGGPGLYPYAGSEYVLAQDGHNRSFYDLGFRGLKRNTEYVASCWSAYNEHFDGWKGMFWIHFESPEEASESGNSTTPYQLEGWPGGGGTGDGYDFGCKGPWSGNYATHNGDVPGWVFETQVVDGQLWEHRYLVVESNDLFPEEDDELNGLGQNRCRWYLGYQNPYDPTSAWFRELLENHHNNWPRPDVNGYDKRPTDPQSRRYFTDIRFEELNGKSSIETYLAGNLRKDGQSWADYPDSEKRNANE